MWSRDKINSVLATIYFISAPDVRTCTAEIKYTVAKMFWKCFSVICIIRCSYAFVSNFF